MLLFKDTYLDFPTSVSFSLKIRISKPKLQYFRLQRCVSMKPDFRIFENRQSYIEQMGNLITVLKTSSPPVRSHYL